MKKKYDYFTSLLLVKSLDPSSPSNLFKYTCFFLEECNDKKVDYSSSTILNEDPKLIQLFKNVHQILRDNSEKERIDILIHFTFFLKKFKDRIKWYSRSDDEPSFIWWSSAMVLFLKKHFEDETPEAKYAIELFGYLKKKLNIEGLKWRYDSKPGHEYSLIWKVLYLEKLFPELVIGGILSSRWSDKKFNQLLLTTHLEKLWEQKLETKTLAIEENDLTQSVIRACWQFEVTQKGFAQILKLKLFFLKKINWNIEYDTGVTLITKVFQLINENYQQKYLFSYYESYESKLSLTPQSDLFDKDEDDTYMLLHSSKRYNYLANLLNIQMLDIYKWDIGFIREFLKAISKNKVAYYTLIKLPRHALLKIQNIFADSIMSASHELNKLLPLILDHIKFLINIKTSLECTPYFVSQTLPGFDQSTTHWLKDYEKKYPFNTAIQYAVVAFSLQPGSCSRIQYLKKVKSGIFYTEALKDLSLSYTYFWARNEAGIGPEFALNDEAQRELTLKALKYVCKWVYYSNISHSATKFMHVHYIIKDVVLLTDILILRLVPKIQLLTENRITKNKTECLILTQSLILEVEKILLESQLDKLYFENNSLRHRLRDFKGEKEEHSQRLITEFFPSPRKRQKITPTYSEKGKTFPLLRIRIMKKEAEKKALNTWSAYRTLRNM